MVAVHLGRLSLVAVLVLAAWGVYGCGSDSSVAEQGPSPISQYRAYVADNATTLVKETQALKDAIDEGDVAGARARYLKARYSYGRIKPVAVFFRGLELKIDPRYSVYANRFVGFHRIEKALWAEGEPGDVRGIAGELLGDVTKLKARVSSKDLTADQIVTRTHQIVDEIYSLGLIGLEEAYSHLDLVDVDAKVEGIRTAFGAVEPQLGASQPSEQTDAGLQKLETTLDRLRKGGSFTRFDKLPYPEIAAISNQLRQLEPILTQARAQL